MGSNQILNLGAVNVYNFVSIKPWLKDTEKLSHYKMWKEQMMCLLESQGLLDLVIDRNNPAVPPETSGSAGADGDEQRRRLDRLVKGWILGSIGDDAVKEVMGLATAKLVWSKLDKIFRTPASAGAAPSTPPQAQQEKGWNEYLPLYRAALSGDWNTAKEVLDGDQTAGNARIAFTLETALHIAVGTGKALGAMSKLVHRMSKEDILLQDELGYTALHVAALTGNTAAAKLLVETVPELLYVPSNGGTFAVHLAALSAHRDTLLYLISETSDEVQPGPYVGEMGVLLLTDTIASDFFDIAIYLAEKYPDLARMALSGGDCALSKIARKESAFYSGMHLNTWERFVYSRLEIPSNVRCTIPARTIPACTGDIEQQTPSTAPVHCGSQETNEGIKFSDLLVPRLKALRRKKLIHYQALELVKCLCKNMESLEHKKASALYKTALLAASRLGIYEIVEVIVGTFPAAIYSRAYGTKQNMFHVAIENRSEKVFNLIYQTSGHRHQYSNRVDGSGNTILHLAAKLAPPHKLNAVSGAALQMQREIQWFKEVEKVIHPFCRERTNKDQKTPKMLFTEEHATLKAEGEKWMKDTANSCTISATLIATVVFAAAITVPGGNEDDGHPIFSTRSAFIIFAVTDAASLFTSVTSLLMFLSIMTSRYAEEDFLYKLPKRLIMGLLTLFISISFLMAAFSVTLFLVFGDKRGWVLIPVALLACLPVASFVLLQFPLLVDVTASTYGRGIFYKQSDRPFY